MTKTFDPTKPVETRDGREARIISTNGLCGRPIIAVVETQGMKPREGVFSFTTSGMSVDPGGPLDLINVVEKYYINIWKSKCDNKIYCSWSLFNSITTAEAAAMMAGLKASTTWVKTVEIEL